ncbi:unnamed protein product [Mytilus coruscus]|uniref:Uncharacterized protein n=1 Tax=Mytilus coruscus TaxID=42192 RepID=A0A6J8AA26_MYTCO|nr:unnamed protein product [Mytilus coruscus]
MHVDEKGDGNHDCRKNHTGRAKSMESNLAVEMVQEQQCKGCKVSCLIMDDDTTTLARLKQSINSYIVKRSDRNHQRKNIVSDLYHLHEKYKGKLSTSTISYLTKDLDYAIAQNKSRAEQLSQNIKSIIPHSFGDHSTCDLSWCNYHKDPHNYRHKSLQYCKDLNGQEIVADLSKLFNTYAKNSDKLANCGSSQGNESLNQIISSKAPKAKAFGSSESLPFRVCVGIIQKNEGRSYIPQVYETHKLSPGKFTLMHTAKIDKKRKHDKVNGNTAKQILILTKALQNNNIMKDFELKCGGFIDTLSLTKELLPDRKTNKQSYNQESLVKDIVGINYDAQNAIGDVQSLQQLINTLKVPPRVLEKHSFSVQYTVSMIIKLQLTKSRLDTFSNMPSTVCSKSMLNKIARSGLRLNHPILARKRRGVDGVRELLTVQNDGKPRVTKDQKILDSISKYIMSLKN